MHSELVGEYRMIKLEPKGAINKIQALFIFYNLKLRQLTGIPRCGITDNLATAFIGS